MEQIENEIHDRVADWLEYVKEAPPRRGLNRKRSSATVDQYRFSLTVFLDWADKVAKLTDVADLTDGNLGKYAIYLRDEPGSKGKILGPVTQATYIRSLNLFTKWLKLPVRIDNPKTKGRPVLVLDRDELKALKSAGVGRDKLIVDLLADTGMRVGELVNLTEGSVERDNGQTRLRLSGKTGERVVTIQRETAKELDQYIKMSRKERADDQPIFLANRKRNGKSEPITRSGVGQLVRHLAVEAGITKTVYPHLLRHTFGTDWMAAGGEAVRLAQQLGHTDLKMILEVYTHPSSKSMGDAALDFLRKR